MMNLESKKALCALLHEYMDDLIFKGQTFDYKNWNLDKSKEYQKYGNGYKAQYNHAKCISKHLEQQIEERMIAV